MRRLPLAAGVTAAVLATVVVPELRAADPPRPAPRAICGPGDTPETGLQGDVPGVDQGSGRAQKGYNCGLALVGWTDLGGRGSNANMAWAGHCAYIAGANGGGVAVVDVSNPQAPRHVRTIHGPATSGALETIHAVATPERAVLVVGRYQVTGNDNPAPMDVYDVRSCTEPQRTATLTFPKSIHNITLSPDATRVYTTMRLQAADLTDLTRPRLLPEIEPHIPVYNGTNRNFSHEARPSADGTRLYIGGQAEGLGEVFTILDLTPYPAAPPRVITQFTGRGHGINLATIDGRPYVLHSEESVVGAAYGCTPEEGNPFLGAAQPWLTDLGDLREPRTVSQFRLEINEPQNCAAQLLAGGLQASVHYHDVDDPARTTFAMLPMQSAGLRIADLRDPIRPREVAYFNPGAFDVDGRVVLDKAWAHTRYVPETGHIWLSTETGGFWVLELEPQVRRALGLPPRPAVHASGAPARPAAPRRIGAASAGVAAYYCPVSAVASSVPS